MPKAKARKKYFVLVERNEKLSITNVRIFAEEMLCWTAYETSHAKYATVHAANAERSEKISSASSERYADEMPEPEVRFGESPDY